MGGRVDRLQPRAAQPVDGQPAHLDREAGQQDRHAGDVAVVLAGLVGAAEDHVLDEGRVERGALDDGAQHGGGHVVGADRGERTAVAADRGPHRGHDPRLAKGPGEVATHVPILHGTVVQPGRRDEARAVVGMVGEPVADRRGAAAVRPALERPGRMPRPEPQRTIDVVLGGHALVARPIRLVDDRQLDPLDDPVAGRRVERLAGGRLPPAGSSPTCPPSYA